jgi:transposase-like protein
MRAHTHWRWHLDEVYVKVGGEMRYLWRAVDHEGEVLESLVTKERDKARARRSAPQGEPRRRQTISADTYEHRPSWRGAFEISSIHATA